LWEEGLRSAGVLENINRGMGGDRQEQEKLGELVRSGGRRGVGERISGVQRGHCGGGRVTGSGRPKEKNRAKQWEDVVRKELYRQTKGFPQVSNTTPIRKKPGSEWGMVISRKSRGL